MIGHLGADSFGEFTRGVMVDAGVDCSAVATSNQATAIAVIGVDRAAENQIIVASGANLDTHPDQIFLREPRPRYHRSLPERDLA